MNNYCKFGIVPDAIQQWKNDVTGSVLVYLPVLYVGAKLTEIDGVKQTTEKNALKIANRFAKILWNDMVFGYNNYIMRYNILKDRNMLSSQSLAKRYGMTRKQKIKKNMKELFDNISPMTTPPEGEFG